jgi:hypothetical protein
LALARSSRSWRRFFQSRQQLRRGGLLLFPAVVGETPGIRQQVDDLLVAKRRDSFEQGHGVSDELRRANFARLIGHRTSGPS